MSGTTVLNIAGASSKKDERTVGFWQRQFQQDATTEQTVFDVLFGITFPVLCFIFDPLFFRGGIGGRPLLGELQFLAYALSAIEICTLGIWLSAREGLGAHAVAVGGFLITGALISFVIGVAILPFSLIGIFYFGIGLAGFTPFFTFIVFLRNGLRAINLDERATRGVRKLAALALGLLFVVGVPTTAQLLINRAASESITQVLEGEPKDLLAATERLRLLGYLTDTGSDRIVWAYIHEHDVKRRARLERAYTTITGKDIKVRSERLMD